MDAGQLTIEGNFGRDGAVCVRGLVGPELLTDAAAAIDAVLADPSPLALRASSESDGRFVEDFCNWQRIPELESFARRCRGAEIAARLLDSRAVRLHHDHILVKEAATAQPTPWHQDQPYYDVDGRQGVSMWLPVDPVPVASSLQIVAGTHHGPWYVPRTFLDHEARWFPEGTLEELPDYEREPPDRILAWALEPGDAVFFHFAVVHGSAGTEERRRVVSLRYIGDDIRRAPRPWRTSPPFEGLDAEIPAGAPFTGARFPVLYP